MKTAIILLLAFVIGSSFLLTSCSTGPSAQVVYQEIAITLFPAAHSLSGESTLQLAPDGAQSLVFTINPRARFERIEVDGKPAAFRRDGGKVAVCLPEGRGGGGVVKLVYHCVFNDRVTDLPAGYGGSGVIGAQGIYLGSDAGWYPAPRSFPAHRSVRVFAPVGVEVIAAGKRLSRGTVSAGTTPVWEEERPVANLALSASSRVIAGTRAGELPVLVR